MPSLFGPRDLFWPGDGRVGALMSDWALLTAMESVENAWLAALVEHKIAPAEAQTEIRGLLSEDDLAALADGAEAGGNPVIGLVQLLRERLSSEPAHWVHRGLTSQDVLDTAVMICLRDVLDRLDDELRRADRGPVWTRLGAPVHADGRSHPDPARGTDHVRPQGGQLADRPVGRRGGAGRGTVRGFRCSSVGRPARSPRPPSWPDSGDYRNRHRCHGSWSSRSPVRSDWLPQCRGTPRGASSPRRATPWLAAPTRTDGSPRTSPRCLGRRSPSWPRAAAAARRPCLRSTIRCSRC